MDDFRSQEDDEEVEPLSLEALSAAYAATLRGPGAVANSPAEDQELAIFDGGVSETDGQWGDECATIPVADYALRIAATGESAAPENGHPHSRADSEETAVPVSPRGILEAMLFVGRPDNAPLKADQAAAAMQGVEPGEVHDLVRELNSRYAAAGRPYQIVSEGAGYRLTLKDEFSRLRERYFGRMKAARLSQAAVDVLSLVAYNQPIARDEIDRLRDKDSSAILSHLVRRRLLRIDREEPTGGKKRYSTTERFLELLGLETLEDLPQSYDLDPLGM
jgi:segregation and condensation protein B